MLNTYIESELAKLHSSSFNEADRVLAVKIREHLLQFQSRGDEMLPIIDDRGLPLLHSLARRKLFRSLETIEEFYENSFQVDKSGSNYFIYLVKTKNYASANQLISRWQMTGEESKLKKMVLKNSLYLLNYLIEGVKRIDKDSLKILLEIVKIDNLNSEEALKNTRLLYLVKSTLKLARKSTDLDTEVIAKTLDKRKRTLLRCSELFKSVKPDLPILQKLDAQIDELTELSRKMSEFTLQASQTQSKEIQHTKALLQQCKQHFKIYVGDSYKILENLSKASDRTTLRYMR